MCANQIIADSNGLFDLSIDCTEEIHAGAISFITTKEKGTIFMPNMISHYSTAVLLTEALQKDLNLLGGVGYIQGYEQFNLSVLSEYAEDIEKITKIYRSQRIEISKKFLLERKKADLAQTNDVVLYNFICESPIMRSLVKEIAKAAKYDSPVLIIGESGTGKEKITEILHNNSQRMMGTVH